MSHSDQRESLPGFGLEGTEADSYVALRELKETVWDPVWAYQQSSMFRDEASGLQRVPLHPRAPTTLSGNPEDFLLAWAESP